MLEKSLGRWISLLYRYGQIFLMKELEPYAVGKGQFLFLVALYQKDGLPQEELAQMLKIDKGTTARAINKLEKAGYVRREQNREDMRANRVFLTDRALEFKPTLASVLGRWSDIISSGMTKEEVDQAFSMLTKMAHNAIEYIQTDKKVRF